MLSNESLHRIADGVITPWTAEGMAMAQELLVARELAVAAALTCTHNPMVPLENRVMGLGSVLMRYQSVMATLNRQEGIVTIKENPSENV